MVRRLSDSYELEVVEADRFWVRVIVARDSAFPECFQCEVAVFPREVDSEWSDLDVTKPVEKPQTLGEFPTSDAALEHGLALGKFLSSLIDLRASPGTDGRTVERWRSSRGKHVSPWSPLERGIWSSSEEAHTPVGPSVEVAANWSRLSIGGGAIGIPRPDAFVARRLLALLKKRGPATQRPSASRERWASARRGCSLFATSTQRRGWRIRLDRLKNEEWTVWIGAAGRWPSGLNVTLLPVCMKPRNRSACLRTLSSFVIHEAPSTVTTVPVGSPCRSRCPDRDWTWQTRLDKVETDRGLGRRYLAPVRPGAVKGGNAARSGLTRKTVAVELTATTGLCQGPPKADAEVTPTAGGRAILPGHRFRGAGYSRGESPATRR